LVNKQKHGNFFESFVNTQQLTLSSSVIIWQRILAPLPPIDCLTDPCNV